MALIRVQEDDESSNMSATGGCYLISEKYFEVKCDHNDFDVRPGRTPGFFIIVRSEERAFLYVHPGSHLIVSNEKEELLALAGISKMKKVSLPLNSVFIVHAHLQHAGAEQWDNYCLRYHFYFIPENVWLHDSIEFAYGWRLGIKGSPPQVINSQVRMRRWSKLMRTLGTEVRLAS